MKIKKHLLIISPYFISILVGIVLLLIAFNIKGDIKGLLINLAASFFAIPLIFLFYQKANELSKRRLNKEIFDYAKMQIDREALSIVNQLQKMVYPLDQRDLSEKGTNEFLSLKKTDLNNILCKNNYLGFQIFKKWEVTENNLHDILKNSYILKSLGDEQIIALISMINDLRSLEGIQKNDSTYLKIDKKVVSLKIVAGKEMNKRNTTFPDRYLLLKKLSGDEYQIIDFGDFPTYKRDELLKSFLINEQFLEFYCDAISDLLKNINNWLDLTGREFIIDTKMFRLGYKPVVHNM